MKESYRDLRDYHINGPGISVEELEWPTVRAAILLEESNDIHFKKTNRNALVLTLDGSASHMTRMEGVKDDTASKPGEICFIPEDAEVHVEWKNHSILQKTVLLDFDTSMFATYTPEVISTDFKKGHLVPQNFRGCVDLEYPLRILGQEVASNGERGQIFAESVIRLVAIQVAKAAWTHPSAPANDRLRPDARARRAIEFVEAHYGRDISLLEIGTAAGLSITQLTQVFRQATGETPYSYVISRRLRQAAHLLRHSDLPIAHIALDVGFADQAHLTRTFQRRYGKTPKLVRDRK
jgi:AraC-like DNA-binding protein